MTIRIAALLLVMHGLLGSAARAQGVQAPSSAAAFTDPINGLSLDQAIARALEREPSLRAVRTTVDVARGMRSQAELRRNPSISFERREEPAGTDNQTMINVDWPLDLFRRDGRVAVADREIAVAELSVTDRERLLASDVRSRYGEVLVAVRDLSLLDELLAAARRQHDLLGSRVAEGASPPLERDLVDVERRRLEADRVLQLGRAESAMIELKRIIGLPPDESIAVRDTLEDVVNRESSSVPGSSGRDTAESRADVKEAEARVGLADAKVDRAGRNGRFDVSLFGGYTRMDAGFPQFGVSATGALQRVRGLFHYVAVGATVTVPVFDSNQGEIAVARAERSGAAAGLEAARLAAETEVAAAQVRDRRAHEAVQLYGGGGARALARQNLTVVEQSYGLGRSTVFEVLAEQKRYVELERAYTETLRNAFQARTMLKQALGDAQ